MIFVRAQTAKFKLRGLTKPNPIASLLRAKSGLSSNRKTLVRSTRADFSNNGAQIYKFIQGR